MDNKQESIGDKKSHREVLLCAESLVKYYGTLKILSGISLTIHKGETLAIMGPSGSGKTTLLHVLSGILPTDTGRIILKQEGSKADLEIGTLSSNDLSRLRLEQLGFVFQQGLLLPELTILENIALPYMMLTNDIEEAKQKAKKLLDKMGLDNLGNRRLGEVSGGQAQRVAIARALINSPKIIFADEPTGALDSKTADAVLTELMILSQRKGSAVVMVTHDERVAAKCHRIIYLLDGHIKGEIVNGN